MTIYRHKSMCSSVLRNGLQVYLSNINCLNLILVALPTVGVGDTTLSLKKCYSQSQTKTYVKSV